MGASRQRETVPFSGFWVWAPALEELGGPGLPTVCFTAGLRAWGGQDSLAGPPAPDSRNCVA